MNKGNLTKIAILVGLPVIFINLLLSVITNEYIPVVFAICWCSIVVFTTFLIDTVIQLLMQK